MFRAKRFDAPPMLDASQCMSLLHFCKRFGDSVFKVGWGNVAWSSTWRRITVWGGCCNALWVLLEVFGGFGHEHTPYASARV